MANEVELKLELEPETVGSVAKQAMFRHSEPHTERLVSVYYDTAGGKLRKKGVTLRVRETPDGYVQTVKSIGSSVGMFDRYEWEWPVDGPRPDSTKLSDTPVADIEPRKLRPIIRSTVDRTSWKVGDGEGELQFALDSGELKARGREVSVREIEIELNGVDPAKAFDAARRIARNVPVRLGVLSKADRGFALAENRLGQAVKAAAVLVTSEMTAAEGFAVIVQSCLKHFRLNEPLVIRQRDPAALHQVRVAMRRLRTAFALFKPAIRHDEEFVRIREGIRWFTAQLGEARNLDVYLQWDMPARGRKRLWQRREKAYDKVDRALGSKRLRLLMIDLLAWTTLGEWRLSEKASRPLGPFAQRRIEKLWRGVQVHDKLDSLGHHEQHRLRIEIKKLRYALDFVSAIQGGEGKAKKQFTQEVERLQERLGRLNDLRTARLIAKKWGGRSQLICGEVEDEPNLVRQAARSFAKMKKMGPYWSKSGAVTA